MAEDFSIDNIREVVKNFYGESEDIAELRKIPTGLFNTTYDVLLKNNGSAVLRIAPPDDHPQLYYEKGMMRQEPLTHDMVQRLTNVPVPRILLYDPSRMILPRDYIIMEKIDGECLLHIWDSLDASSREKILHQLGRFTAELHSIQGDTFGYIRTLPVMEPQPTWQKAFVIMLERTLEDCCAAGGFSGQEANILRVSFLENENFLRKEIKASFLHLDIWQENILVDESRKITALLDFDRCAWGDPELEFAVLDICGLSARAFFEGYGDFRPGEEPALRRNALYVIFEFLKYVFTNKTRRENEKRAAYYKGQIFRIARSILLRPFGSAGSSM